MDCGLVASPNGDLDIVMIPGLFAQPQVDCPTACDGVPHNGPVHDFGHRPRIDHLNVSIDIVG